jgi:hypothetical protein
VRDDPLWLERCGVVDRRDDVESLCNEPPRPRGTEPDRAERPLLLLLLLLLLPTGSSLDPALVARLGVAERRREDMDPVRDGERL